MGRRDTRALSLPGQDTVRRQLLQAKERACTRTRPRWHLDLGLSNVQNCKKANCCCSGHLVYAPVSWQTKRINTVPEGKYGPHMTGLSTGTDSVIIHFLPPSLSLPQCLLSPPLLFSPRSWETTRPPSTLPLLKWWSKKDESSLSGSSLGNPKIFSGRAVVYPAHTICILLDQSWASPFAFGQIGKICCQKVKD